MNLSLINTTFDNLFASFCLIYQTRKRRVFRILKVRERSRDYIQIFDCKCARFEYDLELLTNFKHSRLSI